MKKQAEKAEKAEKAEAGEGLRLLCRFDLVIAMDGEGGGTMSYKDEELGAIRIVWTPRDKRTGEYGLAASSAYKLIGNDAEYDIEGFRRAVMADPERRALIEERNRMVASGEAKERGR
jgi:hypothetical protein